MQARDALATAIDGCIMGSNLALDIAGVMDGGSD
jgi:hypothetical protein